jgi:type VI secretion system protein ImpG
MLYDYLTGRVVSSRIVCGNNQYACDVAPAQAVTPCGFSAQESLIPPSSRAFQGYSLLLEYFAYPEKFLFVDLNGFDNVPFLDPSPTRFSYELTFGADFPADKSFSKENFRLFCAPAANIFKKDIEPIVNTGLEPEYHLIADAAYPASFQVHSIVSVLGIDRATGERAPYDSFFSFAPSGKRPSRSYSWHYRRTPDNRRELSLSFGGELLRGSDKPDGAEIREENCAITAFCSNGMLPRDEIREGAIKSPGTDFPDFVTFGNITRPTPPLAPPPEEEYLWVFLSHLSSTLTTLSSPASLKQLLRLYEWSGSEGRVRKIDAIGEVSSRPVERIVNGSSIRGIELSVSVVETNFLDTGDIRLFGQILKEFLAQYVSINTFLELVVTLKPSGTSLRWDSLKGRQWPI